QKLDEKVEAEVDDDKESAELRQYLEVIPDDGDDVTVDATPLADGKFKMYLTFCKMLKNFDREDLEVLWRIVKARFEKTKTEDYMDSLLFHYLKTTLKRIYGGINKDYLK
ncbi:hypothetical protein Tco_0224861, partial [Tanacetum coccineum]